MEEKNNVKWANPDAIGFLLCGFFILLSAPSLMGLVSHEVHMAMLPVGLVILASLFLVVFACYRNGDVFGAAMNTIMGVVLIGSVNLMGLQMFIMEMFQMKKNAAWVAAGNVIDGLSFFVFGMTLLLGGYVIAYKLKFLAISFWVAGLGMMVISSSFFGILPKYVFCYGGTMVSQLSIIMLYAGFAILVNESMDRHIVPLGESMFKKY